MEIALSNLQHLGLDGVDEAPEVFVHLSLRCRFFDCRHGASQCFMDLSGRC